jgi:hypothetical protein
MGSQDAADDRKALAERVIAGASVAYGLGFAVVLLHTARLGVPVLELVKPIYILIGLPLAMLAFFSRQILKWLKGEAIAGRDELMKALKEQYIAESDEEKVVIDKIILSLDRVMPWYVPLRALRGLLGKVLQESITKKDPVTGRVLFSARLLDSYSRALYGSGALIRLVNLAFMVVVASFLVFLYVWEIYPRLPMAYGGGAPMSVRLLVKTSEIPAGILHLMGARKVDGEEASMTENVDLLYIASTAYLVQPQTGAVVSLNREVVNGVIYPGNREYLTQVVERTDTAQSRGPATHHQ